MFWGPMSLAIPVVAVVVGFLVVAGASKGVGGDMVGFGFLLSALVGLGIAGMLGGVSAIYALKQKEKWVVLPIIGLLLNLAFVLIGVFYGTLFLR